MAHPIPAMHHPAYHAPAEPGSPFHLAAPDREPLPRPTRTLIVWTDRLTGERRVSTWAEYDPATGEIVAEGKAESGAP